jgi:hypothetical protein
MPGDQVAVPVQDRFWTRPQPDPVQHGTGGAGASARPSSEPEDNHSVGAIEQLLDLLRRRPFPRTTYPLPSLVVPQAFVEYAVTVSTHPPRPQHYVMLQIEHESLKSR